MSIGFMAGNEIYTKYATIFTPDQIDKLFAGSVAYETIGYRKDNTNYYLIGVGYETPSNTVAYRLRGSNYYIINPSDFYNASISTSLSGSWGSFTGYCSLNAPLPVPCSITVYYQTDQNSKTATFNFSAYETGKKSVSVLSGGWWWTSAKNNYIQSATANGCSYRNNKFYLGDY